MRGFGASITDSSAHLLASLPKSRRDATMADLFGPSGNRLDVLRQPMGASDFVAGDFYTYDDVPPGETDYDLSEFSSQPRPGRDPPLAAPGAAAQPRHHRRRDAVEPAGVDEDQRRPGRRPADRRPEGLRDVRAVLREVRAGVRRRAGPGPRRDAAERAAEPQPAVLPRHGPAGLAGAQARRRGRRGLRHRRSGHRDPRLRPQLVDPPRRHRVDPAGRGPRDRLPLPAARLARGGRLRRHRLPLLRRRPVRPDRAARRLPGHRAVVHRVLRLARGERPARAVLRRHAQVARPQPGHGRHPQLGVDGRQLEPRARPGRRPAQRRL